MGMGEKKEGKRRGKRGEREGKRRGKGEERWNCCYAFGSTNVRFSLKAKSVTKLKLFCS